MSVFDVQQIINLLSLSELAKVIINASITGLGAGLGTAVGNYFAQKAILKHLDKIERRMVKKK